MCCLFVLKQKLCPISVVFLFLFVYYLFLVFYAVVAILYVAMYCAKIDLPM